MNDIKILAVDDEIEQIDNLKRFFSEYNIVGYSDPKEALQELKKNYYDIVITDYKMPELSGLDLLINAKNNNAYLYGILITAYAEKSMLENFINKNLVSRLIEKPLRLKELKVILDKAVEECKHKKKHDKNIQLIKSRYENIVSELEQSYNDIIGYNTGLKEVFEKIKTIENIPVTTLITGETGTGKEVIAHAIHKSGTRKNGPFIKLNCSAVPASLFESELFGVTKGAYTGANKDRPGKIELADGGTLFLDEIGEMHLELQAKLLRVLQTKEVESLGSNKTRKIDFRLIAATNRNLQEMVESNDFRMDLFYRLNEFPIYLPPLRERKEDIKDFLHFFIVKFSKELGISVPEISSTTFEQLKEYDWHGNVRELENAVKRVLISLRDQKTVLPEHFNFLFGNFSGSDKPKSYEASLEVIISNIIDKKITLKDLEKDVLNKILEIADSSIPKAVELTGIAKNKFYRNR